MLLAQVANNIISSFLQNKIGLKIAEVYDTAQA